MKKSKSSRLKQRDVRGRTPERILKEHGNRVIFPYLAAADYGYCCAFNDIKGAKEIAKYKDDPMELLRHRDPVNWAKKMIHMKKADEKEGEGNAPKKN